VANRPTLIEHDKYRFLIMDAPTDSNVDSYVEMLKKHNVTALVRACEPTYSAQPLIDAGIHVSELLFTDGEPPPDDVVNHWLDLVESEFGKVGDSGRGKVDCAIAVHCLAGLGRAPVLVAIALMEAGMDPYDAIELIRKKRRGAINAKQLKFIESYRRRTGTTCSCVIM